MVIASQPDVVNGGSVDGNKWKISSDDLCPFVPSETIYREIYSGQKNGS